MIDPIAVVARATAQQLDSEGRLGLMAEVEVALADRRIAQTPSQYSDPAAIASLIVSIASFAWTVYTDLKMRTGKPTTEIRITLKEKVQAAGPDHIVDVVVTQAIRVADDQDRAEIKGSDES